MTAGHRLRRATATETIAGTDPVAGVYVRRACGRRCGEPVDFCASWWVAAPTVNGRRALYRRFLCPTHAARFARRYALALPGPLVTDQVLLPFGEGAIDGTD